jgi:hypothetical protein
MEAKRHGKKSKKKTETDSEDMKEEAKWNYSDILNS